MDSSPKKLRQVLSQFEVFAAAAPACPKCNKPMTPRTAKRSGDGLYGFWGCVAFPACLGHRPLR